jgi:hypothetical protein
MASCINYGPKTVLDTSIVLPQLDHYHQRRVGRELSMVKSFPECSSRFASCICWNTNAEACSRGTGASFRPKCRAPAFPISVCMTLHKAVSVAPRTYRAKADLPGIHDQRNDGLVVVMYLYGKVVCQCFACAICHQWEVIFAHFAKA